MNKKLNAVKGWTKNHAADITTYAIVLGTATAAFYLSYKTGRKAGIKPNMFVIPESIMDELRNEGKVMTYFVDDGMERYGLLAESTKDIIREMLSNN